MELPEEREFDQEEWEAGYYVEDQPCPLCGSEDGRVEVVSTHDDRSYYACCFWVCSCDYRNPHVLKLDDEPQCENCDYCDEHCECAVCDRCNYHVDETCEECNRCDSCCGCVTCYHCENKVHPDNCSSLYDELVCDDCLSLYYTWCDHCERYVYEDDNEHNHHCDCEPLYPRFEFPNNGDGTVPNDTKITVKLPAGIIDEEGMHLIICAICADPAFQEAGYYAQCGLEKLIEEHVGFEWQGKRGNFTKRVSSALYKEHGVKLSPHTISEIGNIARQHSSDNSEWRIEFTRRLNEDASYFYNDESCWWGSYSSSRCALKNWGGLGIRSVPAWGVSGRAWVQPLDENLKPIHETVNAHAYIVYNGYGDLEGYAPARIIAHLTGKSYKKMKLYADPQYVNGDSGYLVADQETLSKTTEVKYSYDEHRIVGYNIIERSVA